MCPLAFLGLDETKSRQVNGLRLGEYSWPLSHRCPDPRYVQSQAGQRQSREVKKHIGPGVCLGFVVVVLYVWLFFLFLVCLGKRLFFKLFNILCVCLCWDICEGSLNSEPREVSCWFGNLMVIISSYPSVGCCTSQAPLPALLVLNVISSSRRFALCFAVFKALP